MTYTAEHFRTAFRGHPAAVAIITAATPAGPVGLTASSVTSVSVAPPTLSFSVMKVEGSAQRILTAPSIAVNLLGPNHLRHAEAFARSGADRFTASEGWDELPTGEPFLPDAPAVFRARIIDTLAAGASRLVLAEVAAVELGSDQGRLVYHERTFHIFPSEVVQAGHLSVASQ